VMDPLRFVLYLVAFLFAVWLVVYLVGAVA
jgi:hypothetical protein